MKNRHVPKYNNFNIVELYSEYGDLTGIQIIRRFIKHSNEYFDNLNESIKDFIRLYDDLTEIMGEFQAFFEAWEEMKIANENFILEVRQVLEDWIDDPRVQKWIVDRLDLMINEELPLKLDVEVFESFIDDLNNQLSTLEDTIESVETTTQAAISDQNDYIDSEFVKQDNKINDDLEAQDLKIDEALNTQDNKIDTIESDLQDTTKERQHYFFVEVGTPQSEVQKHFDIKKQSTIEFANGTHEYDTFNIVGNTNIVFNEKTVYQNTGQRHSFLNFNTHDDSYRGYKGEGNISITGGTMINASLPIFHTNNFIIDGVHFKGTEKTHYIQLCSTRNVVIKNCIFEGQPERKMARRNAEVIQLDNCVFENFPYMVNEESGSYDHTPNTLIFVTNNEFTKGDSGYLYVPFGAHTAYKEETHTYIYFTGNIVNGSQYAVFTGARIRYLYIRDNQFIYNKGYGVQLTNNCQYVYIENNFWYKVNMLFYAVQRGSNYIKHVYIRDNHAESYKTDNGWVGDSYDNSSYGFISATAYDYLEISNNIFHNTFKRIYNGYGGSVRHNRLIIRNNHVSSFTYDNALLFRDLNNGDVTFMGNRIEIANRKTDGSQILNITDFGRNSDLKFLGVVANNILISRPSKPVVLSMQELGKIGNNLVDNEE